MCSYIRWKWGRRGAMIIVTELCQWAGNLTLKITETGQNENSRPLQNFVAEINLLLFWEDLLWEIAMSWSYCHSSKENISKSAIGPLQEWCTMNQDVSERLQCNTDCCAQMYSCRTTLQFFLYWSCSAGFRNGVFQALAKHNSRPLGN